MRSWAAMVHPYTESPGGAPSRRCALTVRELWDEVTLALSTAEVESARAEARDMVALAAGHPRLWPVTHQEVVLSAEVRGIALRFAEERARGAPFAYAVGEAPFRHLTLKVAPSVLIPRQETELLVDLVLERTQDWRGGRLVDVGTGSGAIALALACEGGERFSHILGTDISAAAITLARQNAAALTAGHSCALDFTVADLLAGVGPASVEAIVSNPPYIAYEERWDLPALVRDWEPPEALFSTEGGLSVTGRLIRESASRLRSGGVLALEVDSRRAASVAALVSDAGSFEQVGIRRDLAGRERFVLAIRQ